MWSGSRMESGRLGTRPWPRSSWVPGRRLVRTSLVLLLLCAVPAHADERTHLSFGGGGAVVWNQFTPGLWGSAELWPAAGLWGVRGDVYLLQGGNVLLEGALARQLGGARPHLAIALHLGGGIALGDETSILGAAGLSAQLGIKGPLALGLD